MAQDDFDYTMGEGEPPKKGFLGGVFTKKPKDDIVDTRRNRMAQPQPMSDDLMKLLGAQYVEKVRSKDMNKLNILGSAFAIAPIWIGLLCTVLEIYFKCDSRTVLAVGVGGIGVCLFGLGICTWKASE